MKQLDTSTAELLINIARQHLDRPCNSGLPQHLEYELVAIVQAPDEDVSQSMKKSALELLKEARGAL